MTKDQKFGTGVLLLIVGLVWLFFIVIWLPPLFIALFWILLLLRVDIIGRFGQALLYMECVMSLCLIGYAIYLLVRNRPKAIV